MIIPGNIGGIPAGSAFWMPPPSGDSTGATDGAIITAALAAGAKHLIFGTGTYYDNTQRTPGNYSGFSGQGGLSAGGLPATTLVYVGSAASYINAQGTVGFRLRDLMLDANNPAFTGMIVDLSTASFLSRIEDCTLVTPGSTHAASLINITGAEEVLISGCNLIAGNVAILGGANTNGVSIIANRFGSQVAAAISGLNSGCLVAGNIFEIGTAAAAIIPGATTMQGLSITGNWFGDASGTPITIQLAGNGISIQGNLIGSTVTGKAIQFTGTSAGCVIAANTIIDAILGVDQNAQTVTGLQLGPNVYTSVTTHTNFTAAGSLYVE